MKYCIILLLLLIALNLQAQSRIDLSKLRSDYVLKKNREEFRSDLERKVNYYFNLSINSSSEKSFISFFREIELTLYHNSFVDSIISKSLNYALKSGPKFQRAAVELANSLSPLRYSKEIKNILLSTKSNQCFATSTIYLLNQKSAIIDTSEILDLMISTFPNYSTDPVLRFLYNDLSGDDPGKVSRDQLLELLKHPFQKGKTIIYSLHRKDRTYAGITIIKGPDGRFVRNRDSTIFFVPQLALSTSRLPGYISQGNTPQGIFSIVGMYISPTESIGPTANVLTRIPFEVNTALFYHGGNKYKSWRLEDYKNLLPAKWKDHLPLYEAYYAGQSGRRLIVMHGSTDDVSYFEDQRFYPMTPSKGCLTTKELWDEETGRCIKSDQVRLMNAFYSTNQLKGFLIVINLDNKRENVTLEELTDLLYEAEH